MLPLTSGRLSEFVGANVFKLGVYDAVAQFNIGGRATAEIFEGLGMNPEIAMCL